MATRLPLVVFLALLVAFVSCKKDDSTTQTPPQQTKGTVAISSTPTGAAVWIDGTSSGAQTPTSLSIEQGSHTLKLTLAGYADWIQQITVTAGQTLPVSATMAEAPIFQENFETGGGNIILPVGNPYWSVRQDTSYEGSHALNFTQTVYFPAFQNYTEISSITTTSFSLANLQSAYLRFWGRRGSGDDGTSLIRVQISLDGGITWANISGTSPFWPQTWQRYQGNISNYIGPGSTNVQIRFTMLAYGCGINPCEHNINFWFDAITVTKQ